LVGYNDNYTIDSNTMNNAFYVLDNDKGTDIALISATNGKFGTTTAYMDRIEYTPNPGFSGQDTFSYTVSTQYETSDVTVFVTVEPSGNYLTSGYDSNGIEFGFYYDEGGLKVVIEDENSIELYLDMAITNLVVTDGELDVTVQYNIGNDLHTKIIGTLVDTYIEPVVLFSEMTTPLQALEIQDVNGIGLNEIEVGKTYDLNFIRIPSDTTDFINAEWEIVSGDATINYLGELVANSPGDIVARVYSNNPGIDYFYDDITLTAFNMHTVEASLVGNSYGTIEIKIDGTSIDNPSEVKEGALVDFVVTPSDETIQVVEWYVNGVTDNSTELELEVIVDSDTTVGVKLFKPNQLPEANDDEVSVVNNMTILIDVLVNDTDIEGDTLSIIGFTQGMNGTVIQEGDSLRYDPNTDFVGMDEFEYEINDGKGGTSFALVRIEVTPNGIKLGTGNYQGEQISFYYGESGLIAVLEGQVSTVGDVVAENYTSVVDIVSMDNSVALIYMWEGNIEVSRVVAIGQNAVESEHSIIQAYGVISGIEYTVADDEIIHFTYLDSQGSLDDYNKPDLMYSNTSDGAEILVQRAYQDLSSSGSWGADYIESGYTIAVDNEGNPVVAYIKRNIWKWSSGNDTTYYLHIENPITQENIAVESNYGSNIYSNIELTGGGSMIGLSYNRSGVSVAGTITADPLSVDLP